MNETVTVRVQKVRKNRIRIRLTLFLILAAALLLVAIFADKIVPYDPYAQDLSKSLLPPSAEHWMGTDRYGRDMFSRVVVGAQTSIFSTLALVGVISVFGTAVGTLCGYYGGAMDSVVMRISDVCLAFPGLVFALAIAAMLGGGVGNAVLARGAKSDAGAQKQRLCGRGTALRRQLHADDPAAYPAEHPRPDPGHGHAGHRHDDDGAGSAELSWPWREASYSRMGQYDERYAQPDDHFAGDHGFSRHCNFYIRHGF